MLTSSPQISTCGYMVEIDTLVVLYMVKILTLVDGKHMNLKK